jgi:hypothetical protein
MYGSGAAVAYSWHTPPGHRQGTAQQLLRLCCGVRDANPSPPAYGLTGGPLTRAHPTLPPQATGNSPGSKGKSGAARVIWSDPFDAMTSGTCLRNVHWPGGLWSSVAVGITKVHFGPCHGSYWAMDAFTDCQSDICSLRGATVPCIVGIQA